MERSASVVHSFARNAFQVLWALHYCRARFSCRLWFAVADSLFHCRKKDFWIIGCLRCVVLSNHGARSRKGGNFRHVGGSGNCHGALRIAAALSLEEQFRSFLADGVRISIRRSPSSQI